jgi:hypothetical protein
MKISSVVVLGSIIAAAFVLDAKHSTFQRNLRGTF